ncbi:MAG: helix-turn-helix transcriptional regulator [Armatimonadetes bacterium]|nr:helix-turn-helix transcriptional regulator [Armatimonadota bacterium]
MSQPQPRIPDKCKRCQSFPRLAEALLFQREIDPTVQSEEPDPPIRCNLTSKEREVLRLLSEGETQNAIASNLGCSLSNIKRYCHSIYEKLEVTCARHAVSESYKRKLIQ